MVDITPSVSTDEQSQFKQNLAIQALNRAFSTVSIVRTRLTAAKTYNIGSSGDFAAIQTGWDYLAANIDTAGNAVTFQIADATYTAGLNVQSSWLGGGVVTIQGNSGTPANVHINISASNTDGFLISRATLPARLVIKDMKITATRDCIRNDGVGFVEFGNIVLNPMQFGVSATKSGAIVAANGTGNTLLPSSCFGLAYAQSKGVVTLSSTAYSFSTTTAFGSACAFAEVNGTIVANGATFTGSASSATGQRYFARGQSLIFTNGGGQNFFPGNVAGQASSPSEYT